MKVAVSSTGPGLDAEIDPRFGRCSYFVIVDSDSMEFESIENPNVMAAGGAGIQSAQLVAEKGAGILLTGHCGPNAFQTLQAAGIPVCVGVAGTVREAVENYKKGEISPAEGPSAASKSGAGFGTGGSPIAGNPMGPGFGPGPGGGMRRGMGRGMGGGMGCGMGRGMGRWSGWDADTVGPMGMGAGMGYANPAHELSMLKAQAEALEKQLDEIRRRIDELKKGPEK
jgi:predicted Fe-Mo cluster-binding NifX family protein